MKTITYERVYIQVFLTSLGKPLAQCQRKRASTIEADGFHKEQTAEGDSSTG